MEKAIILFVRHPEIGKVKTRLAKEIGDAAALQIYKQLLRHTHDVTIDLDCDKFVFYTGKIRQKDIWDPEHYFKEIQTGDDLGTRMLHAFQRLFDKGYQRIVIIGSDCPGLSKQVLENAFEKLNTFNVVFGPATDGGYYLLGLTNIIGELFINKKWSTDSVLADSLNDLAYREIAYSLLPVLQDIDTKDDLVQLNYPLP